MLHGLYEERMLEFAREEIRGCIKIRGCMFFFKVNITAKRVRGNLMPFSYVYISIKWCDQATWVGTYWFSDIANYSIKFFAICYSEWQQNESFGIVISI